MATDEYDEEVEDLLEEEEEDDEDLDLELDEDALALDDIAVDEEDDEDLDVAEDLDVEDEEEDEEESEEEDEAAPDDESEESLDVLLAREQGEDDAIVRLDDEPRDGLVSVTTPIGADEFTCRSCFLVKRRAQLADEKKMICLDCA